MSWKVTATILAAGLLTACAAQETTSIASIDARCSEIATTGDDYRYCVETAERSPLTQPTEILQALQAGD